MGSAFVIRVSIGEMGSKEFSIDNNLFRLHATVPNPSNSPSQPLDTPHHPPQSKLHPFRPMFSCVPTSCSREKLSAGKNLKKKCKVCLQPSFTAAPFHSVWRRLPPEVNNIDSVIMVEIVFLSDSRIPFADARVAGACWTCRCHRCSHSPLLRLRRRARFVCSSNEANISST